MPPVWTDEIVTINVPKIIKNCLIEVLDDGELVGQCVLKVEDLLKQTKEKHNWTKKLLFNCNNTFKEYQATVIELLFWTFLGNFSENLGPIYKF